MEMTKNSIKARMEMMKNFVEQVEIMRDSLCKQLQADDFLFDMLYKIQDGEIREIDDIMSELETSGFFKENGITETGEPIEVPKIKYSCATGISVEKPCNGGSLTAYVTK